MKRKHPKSLLIAAAIMLISAGAIYLICEYITASAWHNPAYYYDKNYISDLALPIVTASKNSPLYILMNIALLLQGLLFATSICILSFIHSPKRKKVLITSSVFHAIGLLNVVIFPGYQHLGNVGFALHTIGAGLTILFGNLTLILAAICFSKNLKWLYIALGILGIICGLCIPLDLTFGYGAIFERIAVYTIILGQMILGISFLVNSFSQKKRNLRQK